MKLLYCGDVVGKSGREVISEYVPRLREQMGLDFVVVCGENAAHGFGITRKIVEEFLELGVDVVTLGNHAWDQREIIPYIDGQPRLLRPANYPEGTPGARWGTFEAANGAKVAVVQIMGRLFMPVLDDPFATIRDFLVRVQLGSDADAIIVDVHGEASSEKAGIAHVCDGNATLVVGSHTHVPTADHRILPGGTAFMTDAGMCGDYQSVIGMVSEGAIAKMEAKVPAQRLSPATGEATLCAVYVETDDTTGLATRVAPIRIGGQLDPAAGPDPASLLKPAAL